MRLKCRERKSLQQITLPTVNWKRTTSQRLIRVREPVCENGNVRISEVAVLSAIAAECEDNSNIFEIGTFDGRTTINLAFSSPAKCRVHTLDLPPQTETKFELDAREEHMVEKPTPGARYAHYRKTHASTVAKIHQWLGDSATFDYTSYENSCSLVFVDGSHAYDYAVSDTEAAMKLVKKGGAILWHDYGIWKGVTRALEEIEAKRGYGLKCIRGTSLVYWKNV